MRAWGMWSHRRAGLVVALWVLAIVAAQVASGWLGTDFRNSFALPGTDSQAAIDLLAERFPEASGDADTLVVRSDVSVTEPAVRAEVETLLAEIARVDSVTAVRSPYGPMGASQVSADGTVAYASIQYATAGVEVPRDDLETVAALVEEAATPTLEVSVGGQGVAALSHPEIGVAELIGVAFAAIVLLLAFRSAVAMVLPIVSAAAALGVAVGVIRLASHVMTVSDVAPVLGVLLGLGVGIDYALFIVNRHRVNLRAGATVPDSVALALDTSGRAVAFAGVTVVIALAGLFVTGIEFLSGMAMAAGVAVILTVLAAGTLLPALLTFAGHRVLSRADRRAIAEGRVHHEPAGRGFTRWADVVARRPVTLVLVGVAVLGVIALPAADLRLGTADQGNNPVGTTTRQAYDTLAEAFGPGVNGPLVVAVDLAANPIPVPAGPPAGQAGVPADQAASGMDPQVPPQLHDLMAGLRMDPGVASVTGPVTNADGTAALIRVIPTTGPQDQETGDLIHRVRTDLVPATEASSGITVHVGGPTATFDEFAERVQDAVPEFITLVIGLSMLLLVLAFRSLLVPLVGALLNLLSAAAAFGVVVAVFQWGWGAELIGLGRSGPIEPFLPVILFALLFGLSMDYQVFLVSRMHEEWIRTRDNRTAVRVGHAATGKVVVVAASIMVFVFGAFVGGDARTIKLMGLGMAAAVLLDAFVIRMLIVPAVMHRLGRANWWLPAWLDRILPHLSIEGPTTEVPPVEVAEPAPVGAAL